MKAEWKEKWLTALRSGEYEQGRGALRKDNCVSKFCCLGVLCDIIPTITWKYGRVYFRTPDGGVNTRTTTLPPLLQQSLELSNEEVNHLIGLNDGESLMGRTPKSFEQIADYIERNI